MKLIAAKNVDGEEFAVVPFRDNESGEFTWKIYAVPVFNALRSLEVLVKSEDELQEWVITSEHKENKINYNTMLRGGMIRRD